MIQNGRSIDLVNSTMHYSTVDLGFSRASLSCTVPNKTNSLVWFRHHTREFALLFSCTVPKGKVAS